MTCAIIPFPIDRPPVVVVEVGTITFSSNIREIGTRTYWLTIEGGDLDGLVVHDDPTHSGAMQAAGYWIANGYRLHDLSGGAE